MATSEKQQFSRHIRNIHQIIVRANHDCEIVLGTLLILWSKHLQPDLTYDALPFSEEFAAELDLQSFLNWLYQQEFLNAAYWLSSTYSIFASREYRKNLAMFFTPPLLAQRLLDDLEHVGVSFAENSFFDPACGGAAFLGPIAVRMKAALKSRGASPEQILTHIQNHLFGTDIDPILCQISKHILRMVVADEIIKTQIEPDFRITRADSLKSIKMFYETVDVVVCNPPYRKMLADEVVKYREEFQSVITAQPNLYSLFMALCLRLLHSKGIAALITPTSFMSGQSFSKLRCHLMENSEILHIGIVSDRGGVFIDVEQETAVTILRRRANGDVAEYIEPIANIAVVSREGKINTIGPCILPNSGSSWPIPRINSDIELIKLISKSKYRLYDYGYTPRIGMFVWNRDTRPTFFSWEETKEKNATAAVPLLWSSDIRKGGKIYFSHGPKKNNEPSFVDVLNNANKSIVRNPSVVLQRVTSNDQAIRLVAAEVPYELFQRYGGFVGENHTVILEANDPTPVFPPSLLVSLLSSQIVDRYFRCISGATNVSIFELSQLPLPSPSRFHDALATGLTANEAVLQSYCVEE